MIFTVIINPNKNEKYETKDNLNFDEVSEIFNNAVENKNVRYVKIIADYGHHMVKIYSIDRTWYNDKCVVVSDKRRRCVTIVDETEPEFVNKMENRFKKWAMKY